MQITPEKLSATREKIVREALKLLATQQKLSVKTIDLAVSISLFSRDA
jgi:hypothetical protein